MLRIIGLYRRPPVAARACLAGLPLVLLLAPAVLSGGPGLRADEPRPEQVSGFFRGAVHLAVAEGRAACVDGNAPFAGELRTLTAADIRWVGRGLEAVEACAIRDDAVANAILALTGDRPAPPNLKNASDIRAVLERLRIQYRTTVQAPSCPYSAATRTQLEAAAVVGLEIGSAAAGTMCAIATWSHPLPVALGRDVQGHLESARAAIQILGHGTQSIVKELSGIADQIGSRHGDDVYAQLIVLADAIESTLAAGTAVPKSLPNK